MIGPYKLMEQIGEGGFGVVFMAEQTKPIRRKVALKILKPGMDTPQVIARFEAERQALALMDHPNIAKVLDAGTVGPVCRTGPDVSPVDAPDPARQAGPTGRPYFVMELVKGIAITEFCDRNQMPIKERLELFGHVCRAVRHAHQKGILHRDIKPSNVLVTIQDGVPLVKIIDFGIAKALGQQLTDKTLFTGFAQMIGTPLYMSPEQAALSNVDVDTRSDIYSMGVLLYELLTGTTPFDKERLHTAGYDEMRRIIREEEPPTPSTRLSRSRLPSGTSARAPLTPLSAINRKPLPPQVPPGRRDLLWKPSPANEKPNRRNSRLVRGDLDWIVMKALDKDRNRRYETASAFGADVERYLKDEAVEACPPSAGYRLRKYVRRHRAGFVVGAVVTGALFALIGSIGWVLYDRAGRHAETTRQVQGSLTAARILLDQNQPNQARQQLDVAKSLIGNDHEAFLGLASEVEAFMAELDRWQNFLRSVDFAHDEEIRNVEGHAAAVMVVGQQGSRPTAAYRYNERQPARAIPLLVEALARYEILEREDWCTQLEHGVLGKNQVEQVRRIAYETLLWLANDLLLRHEDHRLGEHLSGELAAQRAFTYLRGAASAGPLTQGFYKLRADCHEAMGQVELTAADRELARTTPPTIAYDYFLLGQSAFYARNLAEGIKAFDAGLRLEPAHFWSMMWLGTCLCDLGRKPEDFREAARVFGGCIAMRPEHGPAHRWRGLAYRNLQRMDEALADFSKAIELNPKGAAGWYYRGIAFADLRQWDKAIADYSKSIDLDPVFAQAWVNRGNAYESSGRLDKALLDFTKATSVDPKFALAWSNRGNLHQQLRQWGNAVSACTKAITLDSKLAPAWSNRGNAYRELKEFDKAIADYSQAIAVDPDFAPAWSNRGLAHEDLGKWDKALADHAKAIALAPTRARVWLVRANAYGKLGRLEKVLPDLSEAIKLDPGKAGPVYMNRANVYRLLGRWREAVADWTKVIDLDPSSAEALSNRGAAYGNMGQFDKALADISNAIKLIPNAAMARAARGFVYHQTGQLEKAITDYSAAIELDANFAPALNHRGRVYLELGQTEKALADFSKYLKTNPMDSEAWLSRSQAYAILGQKDKALDAHTKSKELIGRNPELLNDRACAWRLMPTSVFAILKRRLNWQRKRSSSRRKLGRIGTLLGRPITGAVTGKRRSMPWIKRWSLAWVAAAGIGSSWRWPNGVLIARTTRARYTTGPSSG